MSQGTLENDVLRPHLKARGFDSLVAAMLGVDQEGSFDQSAFVDGLNESLKHGRFRLVLVLDEAPPELVHLVGYIEAVAEKLIIDLVTVSAYEVAGSRIVVPQRIEPEQSSWTIAPGSTTRLPTSEGRYVDGADDFAKAIEDSPAEDRPLLNKRTKWAVDLERQGLVKLGTYHGITGRLTLLPRLRADNVGLVTIWNDNGPYLQFWRSVIARRPPSSLEAFERIAAPAKVGQGAVTRDISDELLTALTDAYRIDATGHVNLDQTSVAS